MKALISPAVLLTVMSAIFAAGSARGADAPATAHQQVVRYSDLNLQSPAGALALYHRIQAAAKDVCEASSLRDLGALSRTRACLKQAVKEAVFAVNNPALTQRYLADAGLQKDLVAQVLN